MIIGSGFDECPTTILAELRLTVIYKQMHSKTKIVRRMSKKQLTFPPNSVINLSSKDRGFAIDVK